MSEKNGLSSGSEKSPPPLLLQFKFKKSPPLLSIKQ